MGGAGITVLGEAIVDLVGQPDGRTFRADPGGSPANMALGLARLEVPVTLVTGLADDSFGRLVTSHLTASGVDLRAQKTPFTGLAVVSVDAAGVPSYDFALSWEAGAPDLPADTVALHTGSFTAALPPGAERVEAAMVAARATASVTYDPNIRPTLLPDREAERRRVERQVALSDVVKASEEDLEWLYPGVDPVEIALGWRGTGPGLVVVTLGGRGCVAITAEGVITRPVLPVEVVDTIGAGDGFMAGLLSGLHAAGLLGAGRRNLLAATGHDGISGLLDVAARVAALTCSRPGADLPTARELREYESTVQDHV